jgi:hypothetical protein
MNYLDFMRRCGDLNPKFIRLASRVRVSCDFEGDRGILTMEPGDDLTDEEDRALELNYCSAHIRTKMDMVLRFKMIQSGPKIFRPTAEQCRLLQQMRLNISIADFVSPYDILAIEWPAEFASTKILEMGIDREAPPGAMYRKDRPNQPAVSIVYHVPGRGVMHQLITESCATYIASYGHNAPWPTFEDWMDGASDESEIEMRRIALAYCMLLDEYGTRRASCADPASEQALRRKAALRSAAKMEAKRELAALPYVYEIDQTPILAKVVARAEDLGAEEPGSKKRPHHRRGHYARVACGVGRAERRLIRRPPVFVNGHLFLGSMANTRVIYEHK